MALIEPQTLRDSFAVPTEIKDARLLFCLDEAARTLEDWTGATVYADAASDNPANAKRAAALKSAESYLAMYELLLNTGVRIRAAGVAKKETDNSGAQASSTSEYLTPKELAELRAEYFAKAERLARKYLVVVAPTAKPKAATLTLAGGWRRSSLGWDWFDDE